MNSKTITLKFKGWLLLCFVMVMALSGRVQAQAVINTPNPPYSGTVTSGARNFVTFVIENTNNVPYRLNQISTFVTPADNNAIYRLYYSPTSISGAGTLLSGWTQIAQTTVGNTVAAAGYDVLPFTGLNFEIPANTQYRFALGVPPAPISPAGTINNVTVAAPNSLSSNGIILKLGDFQIAGLNVGYSGSLSNPSLNLSSNPVF